MCRKIDSADTAGPSLELQCQVREFGCFLHLPSQEAKPTHLLLGRKPPPFLEQAKSVCAYCSALMIVIFSVQIPLLSGCADRLIVSNLGISLPIYLHASSFA